MVGSVTLLEDDDAPKKTPKATIIRRVILVVLALTATGWLVYTRLLVKKVGLGEPCGSNMHCRFEAPKCLKSDPDQDGVCSRACANDNECAEGIKCVKVELEEYDERGRPLEGGYCFPQAILDARKKKKDGGSAEKHDSWIDIPESPGFEGEVELKFPPGRISRNEHVEKWLVKGSLSRRPDKGSSATHEIFDASSMRVFVVDDKQQSFTASALSVPTERPSDRASFSKTDRKDRVADRDCEIWTYEKDSAPTTTHGQNRDTWEMCVITGASLVAFAHEGRSQIPSWVHELALRNALPLRVMHKSTANPTLAPYLDVTKIEAKPIDPAKFIIPKSYTNKR